MFRTEEEYVPRYYNSDAADLGKIIPELPPQVIEVYSSSGRNTPEQAQRIAGDIGTNGYLAFITVIWEGLSMTMRGPRLYSILPTTSTFLPL